MRLLVAGAIGLLLYFGHVAFVPIALALLLALVLSGPVEALHGMASAAQPQRCRALDHGSRDLRRLGDYLSVPAQQWFAAAPHTLRLIERKNSTGGAAHEPDRRAAQFRGQHRQLDPCGAGAGGGSTGGKRD